MDYNAKTFAAYEATTKHYAQCEFCKSDPGNALNCPEDGRLTRIFLTTLNEQENSTQPHK